jgi:hypothetical protein
MTLRYLLRFFRAALSFRIVEEGGGGATPAPAPAPVEAPAAPVEAPAAAPAVSTPAPAPKTMHEAMWGDGGTTATPGAMPAPGQPRDEQGRFASAPAAPATPAAPVAGAPAAAAPTQAAKPPAAPAVAATPAAPDDLTMPEGLQPKAQERFQKLAETVKTTTAERDEARGQVAYVRETFQRHGIAQPQFEQAAEVIGMLNRGDYQGALAALDEQRKQIALLTGTPLPGVDALQGHPDLRQAVDQLQISEAHALLMARDRQQAQVTQRQQQEQQQTVQAQQREQQAVQHGLQEVDQLCAQLKARDLDFDHIEAQLLPSVQVLLQHLPPNQWKNAIQTQYDLLKRVASQARTVNTGAPAGGGVLRPMGSGAPSAPPKTMFDAMWANKG